MTPSFSGAFDLSKLKGTQPSPSVPSGLPSESQSSTPAIASYLVVGDESTLRNYLQLSSEVVVLMVFTDPSDAELEGLRADLVAAMTALDGRMIGIEIAAASNPQLVQAVGVSATPGVVAVIGGQPAPLFQGRPESSALTGVLQQVLQMATQNGVNGRIAVAGIAPAPQQPVLTPAHQSALDAFERGDLVTAQASYQAILKEFPNDQDAKIGLAQAQFLQRLQQADPSATGLNSALQQADLLYAAGDLGASFNLLLDEFVSADNDDRGRIRERLVHYFMIAGDEAAEVSAARRRLASLLF